MEEYPAPTRRVFLSVCRISAAIRAAHEVRRALLIALAESFTVLPLLSAPHMRMTVFIAVPDVWPAMIIEILPRAFHAILKATALDVVKLPRRCIPTPATWTTITILTITLAVALWGWSLLRAVGSGRDQSCGSQEERKCRNYKSIEIYHSISPSCCGRSQAGDVLPFIAMAPRAGPIYQRNTPILITLLRSG